MADGVGGIGNGVDDPRINQPTPQPPEEVQQQGEPTKAPDLEESQDQPKTQDPKAKELATESPAKPKSILEQAKPEETQGQNKEPGTQAPKSPELTDAQKNADWIANTNATLGASEEQKAYQANTETEVALANKMLNGTDLTGEELGKVFAMAYDSEFADATGYLSDDGEHKNVSSVKTSDTSRTDGAFTGGLLHQDGQGTKIATDSVGTKYAEFGYDGPNGQRQYFKFAVTENGFERYQEPGQNNTPVLGEPRSDSDPSSVDGGLVPTSSELKEIADTGIEKLRQVSNDLLGSQIADTTAALLEAGTSVMQNQYGPLYDAIEPGLETAAQGASDIVGSISDSVAELKENVDKTTDFITNPPEIARLVSPTLGMIGGISDIARSIGQSTEGSERDIKIASEAIPDTTDVSSDADLADAQRLEQAQTGFGNNDSGRFMRLLTQGLLNKNDPNFWYPGKS